MAEPLKKVDGTPSASGVYDTSPQMAGGTHTHAVHSENPVHHHEARGSGALWAAKDTVRWGPILAGLFTALSSLVVFTILGVAVGLSAVDPGDRLSEFGMGAGWWSALSALLAFLIGGFVAGCTASLVRGTPHGAVNGFMVWAVTIPLILFVLTGGVTAAFRTAGNVAATAVEGAAPAAGQVAGTAAGASSPDALANQARSAAEQVQQQASSAAQQVQQTVTPEKVQQVAQKAAPGAWWTLGSLLVAMIAAVLGGVAGGRWHAGSERSHAVDTVRA